LNLFYTESMKTAISIPDDIFEKMEETSKKLGVSRSEIYRRAALEFLKRQEGEEITHRLNEVYSEEDSSLDPVIAALQYASLEKEQW
jgi:metal-responsive CopG/Arc/MetJ family transcriptional regulator